MRGLLYLAASAGSALLAIAVFVVRAEYGDWGRRLARLLLRSALSGLTEHERAIRQEEWEAELEAVWSETDNACTGLVYAACLSARYAPVGLVVRLPARATAAREVVVGLWRRDRRRPPLVVVPAMTADATVALHRCNGCGAWFRWGRLPSGRFVPLDPIPSGIGELVLLRDGMSVYPLANKPVREPMTDAEAQARRYRNHHQTCPLGYWWHSFAHLSDKLKRGLDDWYGHERQLYETQTRLAEAASADRQRRGQAGPGIDTASLFD